MKNFTLTLLVHLAVLSFFGQNNGRMHVRVKPVNLIEVFQENGFLKQPDELPGLWLWLDADDTTTLHTDLGCSTPVTATGDRVGCWEDKSGNGFDFTAPTIAKRPEMLLDTFNGIANAVNFVEASKDELSYDLLAAEELAGSDVTFFMVFRANVVAMKNNAALFASTDNSTNPGSWEMDFKNTDNQFRHTTRNSGGGNEVAFFDTNVLDIKLYTFTYDSVTYDLTTYVDGQQKGTSFPDTLTTDNMFLGVNRQGSTFADAQIAEVIMYDRLLGICEINEIILYLSIKYDQASFQPIPVPGGVDCSELFFWLRTNVGVGTPIDGTPVSIWEDKAFSNKDMRQPSVGRQPIYRDNPLDNINFTPVVDFDGVNDVLTEETVIGGTNRQLTTYIVAKEDVRQQNEIVSLKSSSAALDRVLVQSPDVLGNLKWDAGTSLPPQSISSIGIPFNVGEPSVVRYTNDTLTQIQEIYVDGALVASDASAQYITGMDSTIIGGINNFYDGKISEVLIYETSFSAVQINNIDTYLALKHGVTLSHDYYDTDTNLIYDVSNGYANGIFGVGKDLFTALDQRKSRSQELNEAVTIELTNEVADQQFLISGHDNGGLARTTIAGDANVLTQIWYAEMTGDAGTVNMELDLADVGANTTPAPADVKILIADNPAFNNVHFIQATSVVGGIAYFEGIPLYDKYYTFSAAP